MTLFNNYLQDISKILTENRSRSSLCFSDLRKSLESVPRIKLEETVMEKTLENTKNLIQINKNELANLFGMNPFSFQSLQIGAHPDFKSLGFEDYEQYYCVSMFMDIQGSTRLNEKYNLFQIKRIKDAILTLAIYVSLYFGGHVHRLQGDGIFLQFVRKGLAECDAVINALNTASVLTYFISTDLASIFISEGVEPLSVRIGIDLGFEKDVLWSYYGIPNYSELTTTSLHTDLAAKLQAAANSNGILVGENIRTILDINEKFCEICTDSRDENDLYIYKGSKNYKKFNFNWKNYLSSFDFIKKSSNKLLIEQPQLKLICKVKEDKYPNEIEYYQNSRAIVKGSQIKFDIMKNGCPYKKEYWESIEWKAFNSGTEAKRANQITHNFDGRYKDLTTCYAEAAYLGHHYIRCIIKSKNSKKENILTFPIFII